MKQVAAFAFKRPTTAWLLITDDEWRRLDGLEAWTVKLFALLLICSDFKTGHGRTGYGELVTGMTPDQPAAGPRLWTPTRNDVKKALYRFEALGLAVVDRIKSEKAKALFFHVPARTRASTPARKQNPELNPRSTEVKRARTEPRIAPGESEKNSKNRAREAPVDNSPVLVADAVEKLKQTAARLRAGAAPDQSPQGGMNACPAGTPPGAARPPSAQADGSLLEDQNSHQQMDEA